MKFKITYPNLKDCSSGLQKFIMCMCIIVATLITGSSATAQDNEPYEEFIVTINVQRIGSAEIPAIIHGTELFLPAHDLFDFLKIKNSVSSGLDSVYGFFIDPKAKFIIDKTNLRINYHDQEFFVKRKDFYKTDNNLYIKSDYFGKVFGLDCKYDFRSLSVVVDTKIELPAIREMQQELMRRNINQLKGNKTADTTIKRDHSWFKLGTADWSVNNYHILGGKDVVRAELGLGAVIAGGEATAYLRYNSNGSLNNRDQTYRWRFVNNSSPFIKQITAGHILPQSIATIDGPITGFQVTNTPTTYRRSFGSYRLSDKTEPDWMVELYVNGVLVNYLKADASGFFTFEVPLVYGNSSIKLKFYSPWGEERSKEVNISIPFNFMPVKQFEYSLSGGVINDDLKRKFSRLNFNYGLNQHITLGGGVEYLYSKDNNTSIPFVNASVRVGSKLMLSGEHAYGVRSKGMISYRMPANLQLDINYAKYNQNQTAVRFNYLEETRFVLSMPIKSRNFSTFSRLSVNQYKHFKDKNTTAELLFSSLFKGVSSNFTTFAEFKKEGNPLISSNLSVTFRLPWRIRFTPQALYEYKKHTLTVVRCEAEKSIFKQGFINVSYQQDLVNHLSYTAVGMRFNFGFAQASVSAIQSKTSTSISEAARGSFIYDGKSKTLTAAQPASVGKAGIIVVPFLDINCNGKKDPSEPKATGLNLSINGGRTEYIKKDTTIRITNLEAYNNYFIELDKRSFENVAWQLKNKNINISLDANHFKILEVPVAVVGEVSGYVQLKDSKGLRGQGRVIINIHDKKGVLVARTVSEADGYFTYLGLPPGDYTAEVDNNQCQKLNMTCPTGKFSFTIKPDANGDVVDGVQFIVTIP